MKLAATLARSLQADMQAELRDLERAVATGTKAAGQRPQDRAPPPGRERRARPAARQQLARQALPEPEARCREPGLHQGAADHPRLRRRCADPEQARALPRDPDRERAEERDRRQARQPEHFPGAPVRAAAVRAAAERPVVAGRGWASGLVSAARPASLRGFRRATERARQSGQGATTVVMFLLVPQVKLPKRLDVARAAEHWAAQLPTLIDSVLSGRSQ